MSKPVTIQYTQMRGGGVNTVLAYYIEGMELMEETEVVGFPQPFITAP